MLASFRSCPPVVNVVRRSDRQSYRNVCALVGVDMDSASTAGRAFVARRASDRRRAGRQSGVVVGSKEEKSVRDDARLEP